MPAIDQLIRAFEQGDLAALDALVTDDLDLRIEHFRDDEVETDWQRCTDRAGFHGVLGRLSVEVFPQGTEVVSVDTRDLGEGWTLSALHQRFFYPVRGARVRSRTWILAHEHGGRVDYFRETVPPVETI